MEKKTTAANFFFCTSFHLHVVWTELAKLCSTVYYVKNNIRFKKRCIKHHTVIHIPREMRLQKKNNTRQSEIKQIVIWIFLCFQYQCWTVHAGFFGGVFSRFHCHQHNYELCKFNKEFFLISFQLIQYMVSFLLFTAIALLCDLRFDENYRYLQ